MYPEPAGDNLVMDEIRVFVAGTADITVVVPAPGVSEAYDIMVADRVPAQTAADMAVAAAKDGRDPVEWARHFVELRQQLRNGKLG